MHAAIRSQSPYTTDVAYNNTYSIPSQSAYSIPNQNSYSVPSRSTYNLQSPRVVEVPMDSERGLPCRCFQDFSSKAPRVDPREMFVNVVIREVQDVHVLKHVHDMWQGLRGRFVGCGGKNQYSGKISDNIFKENEYAIKQEIIKAFQKRGYLADAMHMVLPPSRGSHLEANYLQLTRDALPMLIAFRVQLSERYERSTYYFSYRDLMKSVGAGGLTELVPKEDAFEIGKDLENALFQYENTNHLRPIKADVSVKDCAEQMQVLYSMHWSEDQAANAILQARCKRKAGHAH